MRLTALYAAWIVMALTTAAVARADESPSFEARTRGAERVAESLHRCPNWYGTPGSDVSTRQEITRIYSELARYDTNTVRAGIALYLYSFAATEPERHMGGVKVFAFLRVFFKVPEILNWHQMYYGTFGNPHLDDTTLNFLWPYSVDGTGALVLTGEGTFMSGPPYNPLADFDRMEFDKLQRRFPAKSE